MRLGVSFAELIDDLRTQIGRSEEPGHGISDLPQLKRAINSQYQMLYSEYDWPHISREFARLQMAAGQRYYDLPEGLDFANVDSVTAWWNGTPHVIERGIGIDEYAEFDPEQDERNDPPLRYDIKFVEAPTNATMLEVWPVPATAEAALQIRGAYSLPKLVNDSDICLLDAEAVILRAAAFLLDGDDSTKAANMASARVQTIRARWPSGAPVRLGLEPHRKGRRDRATVAIRG